MTKKMLTRDDILALDDRVVEEMEVPEWDGCVLIQSLDAWAHSVYQQSMIQADVDDDGKVTTTVKMEGSDVTLASLGIINPDGTPMFTAQELGARRAGPVGRVAARIREISGMNQKDEAIEGNS